MHNPLGEKRLLIEWHTMPVCQNVIEVIRSTGRRADVVDLDRCRMRRKDSGACSFCMWRQFNRYIYAKVADQFRDFRIGALMHVVKLVECPDHASPYVATVASRE